MPTSDSNHLPDGDSIGDQVTPSTQQAPAQRPGADPATGQDAVPGRQSRALPRLVTGRPKPVSGDHAATAQAVASGAPAISSDGRFVAFVSAGSGEGDAVSAVYVRDLVQNQMVLVSTSMAGELPNGSSYQPSISADGRFVAFTSEADDIVAVDTEDSMQVYLHDLRTGVTSLISIDEDGTGGDADSFSPSISADGRFIAFTSMARSFDPEHDDNVTPDVYMHDRLTGRTTLISVETDGTASGGVSGQPSVSAGGRLVAFTTTASLDVTDTNDSNDVYVFDATRSANELVSRSLDGDAAGDSQLPAISADGNTIAFVSDADDLVDGDDNQHSDVFVHRRDTSRETSRDTSIDLVSRALDGTPGNDDSHSPSVSGDGLRVAFISEATDLTPNMDDAGTDVDRAYARDLEGGGTALISGTSGRAPGNGTTTGVSMSSWGRHVAFSDTSTDLAGQDRPGRHAERSGPVDAQAAPLDRLDPEYDSGLDTDTGRGAGPARVFRTQLRTAVIPAPPEATGPAAESHGEPGLRTDLGEV